MNKITIDNQSIAYRESGQGQPFVILHGWGCNKELFSFMHDYYESRFRVISIDLPGFGASEEPKSVWGSYEYAECISKLFKEIHVDNPIVFGHSFGGRVLLAMASKIHYDKMILTGSAGLIPKRPLSYYGKIYTYKIKKWIYLHSPLKKMFPGWLEKKRSQSGSADYRNASPQMKKIMVKVVNEDLASEIAEISTPTILLWGTKDTATPLSDGQKMAKLLKDGALIPLENGTHYAILEHKNRCLAIIDAFVGGN